MHLKKIFYCGLICSLLVSSLGGNQSFAFENIVDNSVERADERFIYIDTATSKLSISSSGVANISSSVIGQSMVTKTEVTTRLQQYVDGYWKNIQAWTASSNDRTCVLSKTYSVKKGYSYRVQTSVTAYKGSASERHELTSSTVKY